MNTRQMIIEQIKCDIKALRVAVDNAKAQRRGLTEDEYAHLEQWGERLEKQIAEVM